MCQMRPLLTDLNQNKMNPPEQLNAIGVMQGRLLPKYMGRYQAHPVGYWQDEFEIAASLGLNCIEFILDYNDAEKNPLLCSTGLDEILILGEKSGVKVRTVCADYFMEAPLHHLDSSIAKQSRNILNKLLDHGKILGLTDIVIPCVDQSSMRDSEAMDRFILNITPSIEKAESQCINLSLETDLDPQSFAKLLNQLDSKRITVNYDTGNSAALGFDPVEELATYGSRISDIHIKDRIQGGGSVELGNGATRFHQFFHALKPLNYQGPFIMQAYRDDEGLEVFKRQFCWICKNYLEKQWS